MAHSLHGFGVSGVGVSNKPHSRSLQSETLAQPASRAGGFYADPLVPEHLKRGLTRPSHALHLLQLRERLGIKRGTVSEGLSLIQEYCGLPACVTVELAEQDSRLALSASNESSLEHARSLLKQMLLLYSSFADVGAALLRHEQYRVVPASSLEEAGQWLQQLGVPQTALSTVFESQPQVLLSWGRSMRARLSVWAMIAEHLSACSRSRSQPGQPDHPLHQHPLDLLDVLMELPPPSLSQLTVAELAVRLGFMQHKGLAPRQVADCAAPQADFLASCGASEGSFLLHHNYAWPQSDLQRRLATEFGQMVLSFGGP